MTIINFDDIIGKKFKTITNNIFCLNHPTNCLIIGKTNSGKSNIVMNLIAKNCIYEKIHIYTNNIDDKYDWLKNKFKNDVFIYLDEIDFDKIDKGYEICSPQHLQHELDHICTVLLDNGYPLSRITHVMHRTKQSIDLPSSAPTQTDKHSVKIFIPYYPHVKMYV